MPERTYFFFIWTLILVTLVRRRDEGRDPKDRSLGRLTSSCLTNGEGYQYIAKRKKEKNVHISCSSLYMQYTRELPQQPAGLKSQSCNSRNREGFLDMSGMQLEYRLRLMSIIYVSYELKWRKKVIMQICTYLFLALFVYDYILMTSAKRMVHFPS